MIRESPTTSASSHCNQPYTYGIRVSVAPDGEVHPLVIGPDGLPMWWPNLWLLTTHRNRGASFGTLLHYGTILVRLYRWSHIRRISVEQRFINREWLNDIELHALSDDLSIQVRGVKSPKPWRKRPGEIEQFLAPKAAEAPLVANRTISIRIRITSNYLQWLGNEGVKRAPFASRNIHEINLKNMVKMLMTKVPICHDYNKVLRRSYDREGMLRLLEVTKPSHPENPFRSEEVQLRNHLIIAILFTTGLRIGELGALKLKDIDFRLREMAVARRPDDREDPRGRYSMRQKTRARVIAIDLIDLIRTYSSKVRNRHELALRHPYLLVSEQNGMPISISALEKIFRVLRDNVPGLPKKLTPHYLRHAWNFEWSIVCAGKGIPTDEAEQLRKLLMGWKQSSTMSEIYNQPYFQVRANECSLEVQRRLWLMGREAQEAFDRMKHLACGAKSLETTHG